MKKLNKITFILLLSFSTTQAGFFSNIWNKVVETVKEVKDKASDFLFGQQDDNRGMVTKIIAPFLNITIRSLRIKHTENMPYTKIDSEVFKGELSKEEKNLIDKRRDKVNQTLKSMFNLSETQKFKYPNIGLVFSGGGYRAMIGTLGFLKGLEESNLLDTVVYTAGLSGSTWAIAGWLASNKKLDDYVTNLKNTIKDNSKIGIPKILNSSDISQITTNLTTKFIFDQPLSIVDIYGSIIINNILNDVNNKQEIRLSKQKERLEKENLFLPIYTAISSYNKDREFNWFEINPYVIRNLSNNFYTKTEDFGRKYKNGKSVPNIGPNLEKIYPPEIPLSNFLGIFGSAFSFNLKDLSRKFVNQNTNPIKAYILVNLFAHGPKPSEFRASSYKVLNPTFEYQDTQNNNSSKINLLDAGIDFNMPFPAMIQKEKNIDLIIGFDLSSNYQNGSSLVGAKIYAEKNNLNFPEINLIEAPQEDISVFEGRPTVVYLPFKNNCIDTFCNTGNFAYSEEEFDYVFNTAKEIAIKNSKIIKEVIESKIEKIEN